MLAPKISIVVPVYNVERFLDRCISSIVNQTFKNIEILLINDGSTDGSLLICEKWRKIDSRIKIINKHNEGLGLTRNVGIKYAAGEYICFFDSDDYIAIDAMEVLNNFIENYKSDIIIFGYSNVNDKGVVTKTIIPTSEKLLFKGKEVLDEFLPDLIAETNSSKNKSLHMSAWASLYSMELIKKSNWSFVSERDIIAEDVYSLLRLYKYVENVSIISKSLYFYCHNPTSLTHIFRSDRFERICNFYSESLQLCSELGYNQKIIDRLEYPFVSFLLGAMKMIVKSDLSKKLKKNEIKKIVTNKFLASINFHYNYYFFRNFFIFCLKKKLWFICYILIVLKK